MSEPDSRKRFFQRYTLYRPGGWSGLFVLRHTFEMACLRSADRIRFQGSEYIQAA